MVRDPVEAVDASIDGPEDARTNDTDAATGVVVDAATGVVVDAASAPQDAGWDGGAPDSAMPWDGGDDASVHDAGRTDAGPPCAQAIDECGVCGGTGPTTHYADLDHDGRGDPSASRALCALEVTADWVANSLDAYPSCTSNILDMCGVCDGPGGRRFYADTDGDGLGAGEGFLACRAIEGVVSNDSDPDPLCANLTKVLHAQPGEEGKDTMVMSGYDPRFTAGERALGAGAALVLGSRVVRRSYLDFELAAIPRDAAVLNAILTLRTLPSREQPGWPLANVAMGVATVTAPWSEASTSWQEQPAIRSADAVWVEPNPAPDHVYRIDITQSIKARISDPTHAHGLQLALQAESGDRGFVFLASSDHPSPALRPKLEIEYVDSESAACGECQGRGRQRLYADDDGDGLGDPAESAFFCAGEAPPDFVANSADTLPSCAASYVDECGVCGGPGMPFWHEDNDRDGLGSEWGTATCTRPEGYVANGDDREPHCPTNDTDVCGVCAGPGFATLYADLDGDGLGDPAAPEQVCADTVGYVSDASDLEPNCATNDSDECGVCAGSGPPSWYEDRDGDGLGDSATTVRACVGPPGYVRRDGDPDLDCPTILGDVTILKPEDVAVLENVCDISGNLTISGVVTLALPKLRTLGALQAFDAKTLEVLSLPALTTVGSLYFSNVVALRTVELPALEEASGTVSIRSGAAEASYVFPKLLSAEIVRVEVFANGVFAASHAFPALRHVGRHLIMESWMGGAFVDLFFPALLLVGEEARFTQNSEQYPAAARLPKLERVGALHLGNTAVVAPRLERAGALTAGARKGQRIEFASLKEVGLFRVSGWDPVEVNLPVIEHVGDLDLSAPIESLNVPSLRTLGAGQIMMMGYERLNLPKLESVGHTFIVTGNTIFADALRRVGGDLRIGDEREAGRAVYLSMEALEELGGALIVKNTDIERVSLPRLASLGFLFSQFSEYHDGSLVLLDNPKLHAVDLPALDTDYRPSTYDNNPSLPECKIIELRKKLGETGLNDVPCP